MALFTGLLFALPVPASAEVRVQSSAPCVSDPEALADALRQTLERPAQSDPEKQARRAARVVQRALRAEGAKTAEARAVRVEGDWLVRIDIAVDEVGVVA